MSRQALIRTGIAAILLLAFLAPAGSLLAAQSVGTVIGVQGTVSARDADGDRPLEMTSLVYVQDTIITGPQSKVQILFDDDTILAQGPDSESSLEDYAYLAGGEEDSRFLLDMAEGTFRVISGKIVEDNPDDGFRMQTPLAVIGIRGTMTGHVVHSGQEHHFSLDLHGDHTVNVNARFDGTMGVMDGDFQALDIVPGMPMGHVRDMTPEEQQFMTETTGITSFNPTPGRVLAAASSLTGTGVNLDGSVVYADGTVLNPDGSIVNPDGTVLETEGAVVNADGSILYADGTVLNPDGSITRPDGSVLTPDGFTFTADGTLLDGDGNVVDGSGTIVTSDVLASGTDATGTGAVDTIVSGTTTGTAAATESTLMHSATASYVRDAASEIPPYLLPFENRSDVFDVYGEGASDIMSVDETLGKVTGLGIEGLTPAILSAEMPLHITYTGLGGVSDSQWGYWDTTDTVYYSPDTYQMIRMYEVTVDVPTIVRPDLAGSYSGFASGIMNYSGATETSSTGFFTANVTDITSGSVDFDISVTFGPGVYNAYGTGAINDGTFSLLITDNVLTATTSDIHELTMPGITPAAFTPNPGSTDIFGAVGKDGSMAGTFHFWADTPDYVIGVGEFHGSHD